MISNTQGTIHYLKITPNELYFPPPLNRVHTNVLKLQNTLKDQSVAFKVKTTAPKRYCVRPNTGLIPPFTTVEVQVLLNPAKEKPTDLNQRDKFLIQSIIVSNTTLDPKEVWSRVDESKIVKQKLRSHFSAPNQEHANSMYASTLPDFTSSNSPQASRKVEEPFMDPLSSSLPQLSPVPTRFDFAFPEEIEVFARESDVRKDFEGKFAIASLERDELRREVASLREQLQQVKEKPEFGANNKNSGKGQKVNSKQEKATHVHFLFLILALLVGFLIGKLM